MELSKKYANANRVKAVVSIGLITAIAFKVAEITNSQSWNLFHTVTEVFIVIQDLEI